MKYKIKNLKITPKGLLLILFLLSTYLFFNTAWVDEDAFITFRAVDNLLAGHGPVWNVGERVQVYTHPLWYFLLTIGTAIFAQSYWVAIGLSYLCLLGIIWLLMKIVFQNTDDKINLINKSFVAILALFLSRSFVDYSSSGLENPLIHFLVLLYFYLFFSDLKLAKKYFWTSFVFGLIFLTRPDAIILLIPTSIYLFYHMVKQKQRWLVLSLLPILPVICWEIFSMIYYGSPVPNTALAKTNVDLSKIYLIARSLKYFWNHLILDPITVYFILFALVFSYFSKDKRVRLLGLGIVLQLLYVAYIGADYMLGRFLSASILVSVVIICKSQFENKWSERINIMMISAILVLFPLQKVFTWLPSFIFNQKPTNIKSNVSDERMNSMGSTGVLNVLLKKNGNYKTHKWIIEGETLYKGREVKKVASYIGMLGWASGDKPYFIDPLALSNPFLARLPAVENTRYGHYRRAFPEGYYCTVITGKNQLKSKKLAALYNDVHEVVSGDLWTKERWAAIWRLNTGYYKKLDKEFNRNATEINENDCNTNP